MSLSATSPEDCPVELCKKKLPNFYDDTKDDYMNVNSIEIILKGGKLTVKFEDNVLVNNVDFKHFDRLMDSNQLFLGITSSMTPYKSIEISDLKIYKIIEETLPRVSLLTNSVGISAGDAVMMELCLKSHVGTNLKIFKDSFHNFQLKIATIPVEVIDFNFNEIKYCLDIEVRKLTKAGKIILKCYWRDHELANKPEINIIPADITIFEIVEPKFKSNDTNRENNSDDTDDTNTDIDNNNILLDKIGYSNQDYYEIKIITSDQYRNLKEYIYKTEDLSIGYPNMIGESDQILVNPNKEKNAYFIKIPITAAGSYKIYSSKFFNGVVKKFNIELAGLAVKSNVEFDNYFSIKHDVKKNQKLRFILHLYDSFGNYLTKERLVQEKCSFSKSFFEHSLSEKKNIIKFITENEISIDKYIKYENHDIEDPTSNTSEENSLYPVYIEFTPNEEGQYTLYPIVKCANDKLPISLKCNLCEFFIPSGTFDKTQIILYSDVLKKEVKASNENQRGILYLSLDEDKNIDLTTITFLDASQLKYNINELLKNKNIRIADFKATITESGEDRDAENP